MSIIATLLLEFERSETSKLLHACNFLYFFEDGFVAGSIGRVFAHVQETDAAFFINYEYRRVSNASVFSGIKNSVGDYGLLLDSRKVSEILLP